MITSRHNRRLKDIRRLRRSKGDRALLEGPHLVAEALAAGLALESVLAVPGFFAAGGAGEAERRLLAALPAPPETVAPELLEEVADADSPRGLVAVARLPRAGADELPVASEGVYVFAEGVQDPGNVGALARTAEAAGAAALALAPGSAHPNHPRALRASAGSLLRLPVAVGAERDALDRRLAAVAPRWLALVPRGGEPIWEVPDAALAAGALVLAVGAEGPGLSAATAERADLALTLPLAGAVESLNATVAAALVLYEIRRRRSVA